MAKQTAANAASAEEGKKTAAAAAKLSDSREADLKKAQATTKQSETPTKPRRKQKQQN
jgi:hypothetical protein